jgi:UDP-2-acetamido-2-deoxy-ribo-hexuluronate aminotransferase
MAMIGTTGTYAARDVAELERGLCEYVGAPHCVAVGSAAAGLLMALRASGVGGGAEVVYTGLGEPGTAGIIRLAGGTPVLADAHPGTLCIDACRLENALARENRRPKALVAADVFGLLPDYDALEALCARRDIALIEDMGESLGAAAGGRRAGTFGRMAVGALGENGIIFCHGEEDAARLRSLRCALAPEYGAPDEVRTSIGLAKLAALDLELARRRAVAARYSERLAGHVGLQELPDGCESACARFAILTGSAALRDAMAERLARCRIPCEVLGTPEERLLLLPIHPYLSRRVVDYICDRALDVGTIVPDRPPV